MPIILGDYGCHHCFSFAFKIHLSKKLINVTTKRTQVSKKMG